MEGEAGSYAFEGCAETCGECGCQDSFVWYYKGKSSKNCDWVSKKVRGSLRTNWATSPDNEAPNPPLPPLDTPQPEKYCAFKYKSEEGIASYVACAATCENC